MLFALTLLFTGFLSCSHTFAGGVCTAESGPCGSAKEGSSSVERYHIQPRYPQLFVFVSFSMPLETLKVLAKQVNAVGGALVFRGLHKGSFQEMARKLKELVHEVLIDPTLFEAYAITRVPTFVLRKNPAQEATETLPHDRLSGNVSVRYVLEQFATQGCARNQAEALLQKLKKA